MWSNRIEEWNNNILAAGLYRRPPGYYEPADGRALKDLIGMEFVETADNSALITYYLSTGT